MRHYGRQQAVPPAGRLSQCRQWQSVGETGSVAWRERQSVELRTGVERVGEMEESNSPGEAETFYIGLDFSTQQVREGSLTSPGRGESGV